MRHSKTPPSQFCQWSRRSEPKVSHCSASIGVTKRVSRSAQMLRGHCHSQQETHLGGIVLPLACVRVPITDTRTIVGPGQVARVNLTPAPVRFLFSMLQNPCSVIPSRSRLTSTRKVEATLTLTCEPSIQTEIRTPMRATPQDTVLGQYVERRLVRCNDGLSSNIQSRMTNSNEESALKQRSCESYSCHG